VAVRVWSMAIFLLLDRMDGARRSSRGCRA
jgi:hypothetical protein